MSADDDSLFKSYRSSLLNLEEKMQAAYDKTVLTLSGGAFGVSIVVSKDLIGQANLRDTGLLFLAWMCWAFSLAAILTSFYCSACAMRTAVKRTDQRMLYRGEVGGVYDKLTLTLNPAAGVLFLAGLVSMSVFVWTNLK